MTDAQIISISITVLAILAGSLYNNARISDMAARFGDVNRRIDDSAALVRAEMNTMHAEINLQFERINHQFERTNDKIDALLKLVADIDQRVTTIESRK